MLLVLSGSLSERSGRSFRAQSRRYLMWSISRAQSRLWRSPRLSSRTSSGPYPSSWRKKSDDHASYSFKVIDSHNIYSNRLSFNKSLDAFFPLVLLESLKSTPGKFSLRLLNHLLGALCFLQHGKCEIMIDEFLEAGGLAELLAHCISL